jgi:hypothetical protein
MDILYSSSPMRVEPQRVAENAEDCEKAHCMIILRPSASSG